VQKAFFGQVIYSFLLFLHLFHNSFCDTKTSLHFWEFELVCLFVCLWIAYLFINCRLASQSVYIRTCITFAEETYGIDFTNIYKPQNVYSCRCNWIFCKYVVLMLDFCHTTYRVCDRFRHSERDDYFWVTFDFFWSKHQSVKRFSYMAHKSKLWHNFLTRGI